MIEPAAVIGHVFDQEALAAIVEEPLRPDVDRHLASLVTKQLVQPEPALEDETKFRFHHILIRDAAYSGVLKRARATLHERFADWAERVNRERARETEYDELLGYHLEQAHDYLAEPRAARRTRPRAGEPRRAPSRRRPASAPSPARDMPAAANLLRRAATLLPDRRSDAARAAARSRRGDDGDRRVRMGRDLPRRGGRRGEGDRGRAARGRRRPDAAARAPPHDRRPRGLARGGRARGQARHRAARGRRLGARRAREGVAPARVRPRVGPPLRRSGGGGAAGDRARAARRATAGRRRGARPPTRSPRSTARRRCRKRSRARERLLAQGLANRQAEALVLCVLAHLRAMQGDFDEARELYTRARALLEELGLAVLAAWTRPGIERGRDARRRSRARGGAAPPDYETLTGMGEKFFLPLAHGAASRARCFAQGRSEEAAEIAGTANELAAEDDIEATGSLARGVARGSSPPRAASTRQSARPRGCRAHAQDRRAGQAGRRAHGPRRGAREVQARRTPPRP